MKIAVIDIGSNSVRLMMWADGKTLYKRLITTRLGEGLSSSPYLKEEAMERSAEAIAVFKEQALAEGADKVYAFATAAVRSALNGKAFCDKVFARCAIEVDVVGGNDEAALGLTGALGQGDGGIIDVGGASTEVTVRVGGSITYSRSVNIGTVRILDTAGRDLPLIKRVVEAKLTEYGQHDFSAVNMYGVGGTASRLGAIKNGITQYSPDVINGTVLYKEEIFAYAERLVSMPVEEIKRTTICRSSADLIGGAAYLLASVMDKFNIERITVSESDNQEGYLYTRVLSR